MSGRVESLIEEMLAEQKQTNKLLMLLIQALADEQDPDEAPTHYMDGSPIVPTLSGK